MNIVQVTKKNKLLGIIILIYLVLLIVVPEKGFESLSNSAYYLLEMFQILPVIFMLTVVIEALVPKELILKSFGGESGIRGNLFALLLGSISAGPIYAAFPISKTLLRKGASISNIVIILSAWAVIKVPMLANEVKFLGINFMVVRWILTVTAIFVMAYIAGKFIKEKDLPSDMDTTSTPLSIQKDYCIGCGLCSKMLPDYFEIKENKATIKSTPSITEENQSIIEVVSKCPTKAINYKVNEMNV